MFSSMVYLYIFVLFCFVHVCLVCSERGSVFTADERMLLAGGQYQTFINHQRSVDIEVETEVNRNTIS